MPVEIKAASTFNSDFLKGLRYLKKVLPDMIEKGYLVYCGDDEQKIHSNELINYRNVKNILI